MIGRLRGQVAMESPDGTAVIDVQGVGYEVLCPLGTLGRAPRDAEGRVTLLIHTNVREDAITLFGFSDERERTTFRLLCTVAGVGPRTAITILGVLPSNELSVAIVRADVKKFLAVPGVGKKIAERLVLELKDKLGKELPAATAAASTPNASPAAPIPFPLARPSGPLATVTDMLTRMGFRPSDVDRAIGQLKGRENEPVDTLVRDALRSLT